MEGAQTAARTPVESESASFYQSQPSDRSMWRKRTRAASHLLGSPALSPARTPRYTSFHNFALRGGPTFLCSSANSATAAYVPIELRGAVTARRMGSGRRSLRDIALISPTQEKRPHPCSVPERHRGAATQKAWAGGTPGGITAWDTRRLGPPHSAAENAVGTGLTRRRPREKEARSRRSILVAGRAADRCKALNRGHGPRKRFRP